MRRSAPRSYCSRSTTSSTTSKVACTLLASEYEVRVQSYLLPVVPAGHDARRRDGALLRSSGCTAAAVGARAAVTSARASLRGLPKLGQIRWRRNTSAGPAHVACAKRRVRRSTTPWSENEKDCRPILMKATVRDEKSAKLSRGD